MEKNIVKYQRLRLVFLIFFIIFEGFAIGGILLYFVFFDKDIHYAIIPFLIILLFSIVLLVFLKVDDFCGDKIIVNVIEIIKNNLKASDLPIKFEMITNDSELVFSITNLNYQEIFEKAFETIDSIVSSNKVKNDISGSIFIYLAGRKLPLY